MLIVKGFVHPLKQTARVSLIHKVSAWFLSKDIRIAMSSEFWL